MVAQLPSVLTTTTTGQRGLTWQPLRAAFVDLVDRWGALAARTSDDQRRLWSMQLREMIRNLVAAVDAENEAMAFGYDWRLLRPRTAAAEQALTSALTARTRTAPPTAPPTGPTGPTGPAGGQPGVAEAQL
jgi:hypothetical protein